MQKRFFSHFVRFVMISLVLVGGFFYTQTADAQERKPDFAIINEARARLEGTALYLEWENVTGVWENRRQWEIGFEWIDKQGNAIGERRYRPFELVPGQGKAVIDSEKGFIDSARGQTVRYRKHYGLWRRTFAEPLSEYLQNRPDQAVAFRVTLDSGNAIEEENENNNVAVFRVEQPDLIVEDAQWVDQNRIRFTYRNSSNARIVNHFRIVIEWVDAQGSALTNPRWINVAGMEANARVQFDSAGQDVAYTQTGLFRFFQRNVSERLEWYLRRRPENAKALRITADGQGEVTEADENNNIVRLTIPVPVAEPPVEPPVEEQQEEVQAESPAQEAQEEVQVEPALVVEGDEEVSPDQTDIAKVIQMESATLDELTTELELGNILWDKNDFSLTFSHFGNTVLELVSLWFHFADSEGKQVGTLYWLDIPMVAPAATRTVRSDDDTLLMSSVGPMNFSDFLSKVPAGAASLKILLDGPNQYAEINEENNVAFIEKQIWPLPDIAFVSTRVDFSSSPSYIEYIVINNGRVDMNLRDLKLQWIDSNEAALDNGIMFLPFETVRAGNTVGPLKIYITDKESLQNNPEVGNYLLQQPKGATQLLLTLDPDNRINESDETNNVAKIVMPPQAPPDFSITGLALSHDVLALQVSNKGGNYTGPLSLWFHFSDVLGIQLGSLFWADIPLSPNKLGWFFSTDFGGTFASKDGEYSFAEFIKMAPPEATYIKIIADGPNSIAESNEQNNTSLLPLSATWQPDLTIADATIKDDQLYFTYRNLGKYSARPSSIWFHFADSNGVQSGPLYWVDIDSLPGRQEREFISSEATFYSNDGTHSFADILKKSPSGANYLKILMDGPARITESNELNNTILVEKPLAYRQPDLALTGGARAGGVVRVTIVNNTPNTLNSPRLQFKWLDAKGGVLQTSPVSYWSGISNIAAGQTGEAVIEFEKWREDGVTRFLKNAPSGAVALLALIDPENTLKESDENNNSFRIELTFAELEYGTIEVKDGTLNVEVKNSGKSDAVATDIWMQWYGKGKWLTEGGVLEVPEIGAGKSAIIKVPLDREFRDGGAHLRDLPINGERLRLFLDGSRKVEELNEHNNTGWVERSAFIKVEAVQPKLTLTLALEVIRERASAGAISSFAGGGMTLALAALLAFGFMIHGHHGGRSGVAGFFSIFPLLFTPSNLSYMYLRRCGPQGCNGQHFARYRKLKNATRVSLGAVAGFGILKIVVAALAVSIIGPVSDIKAQALEVFAGDSVRASMAVKNSGTGPATGLTARLPCPSGSAQRLVELNGKTISVDAGSGIAMPDLGPDKAHSVRVYCKVTQTIAGALRFQGDVKYKEGGNKRISSNAVEVEVRLKPQPEGPPDLMVVGVGFLPKSDVTGDSKPFSATFTAIVKNIGEAQAGATSNRLRLDVGSDGTWDFTAPTLIEIGALGTGEHKTASWTIQWAAPLGAYTFEICADINSEVAESNEENNCVQDKFTLQIGQVVQEEEY